MPEITEGVKKELESLQRSCNDAREQLVQLDAKISNNTRVLHLCNGVEDCHSKW